MKKIKKVLVSQPKPTSDKSPYYEIAGRYDLELDFRPFISVEGLTAKEFRQFKVNLADFTAVILTSRHAVDNFFRLCEETRVKIPDTMKYFCTTEAIALYLQKYIVYRKRKIFFGASGKLTDPQLQASINKHHKEKFLFPVSDVHKDDNTLDALKIDYTKAVMYRTVTNEFTGTVFDYDAVMFFSPVGIESLFKNFPDFNEKYKDVAISCFGATTIKAAEAAGLTVDIQAPTPANPSMTAALDAWLKEHDGCAPER